MYIQAAKLRRVPNPLKGQPSSGAIIGHCLHELARVLQADLGKLGQDMAKWRSQNIQPLQFLLNVMSMIPKKDPGAVRMIAPTASGWRLAVRLDSQGERAWCSAIADTDDAARPRSSCLYSMEARQIFLAILKALK